MKIFKLLKGYFFYKKSQFWSKKRIEKYQDQKLIKLVQHAAENVPYYRELFKQIGFDASTFTGRADMYKIPLLDKDTVRNRHKEFIAENSKNFGINYDSTSGSTGTPLKLIIDDATETTKLTCLVRSYFWAGYRLRKKSFGLQSYLKKNFPKDSGLIFSRSKNVYRFDSNNLNQESAIRIAKELNVVKPKFYFGYPLPLMMLGKFALENGIELHSPESIIVYGETLSKARRTILENYYKAKIYDFYSLHECSAIISDCAHGNRHWMEDLAYNEVIDHEGNTLLEGSGELVGTNLYNYAMPLIRYKIRDYVTIANENKKCECGRKFRIVEEIIGRQNDYFETPDGRVLGNVMEHSIDKAIGVILSQAVQDKIDHIYVNLVVDNTFDPELSFKNIETAMRKRIGNDIQLEFRIVQELEKTKGGKTPFILSKIGNNYL
jgi:phenylacetate-CoA ligase